MTSLFGHKIHVQWQLQDVLAAATGGARADWRWEGMRQAEGAENTVIATCVHESGVAAEVRMTRVGDVWYQVPNKTYPCYETEAVTPRLPEAASPEALAMFAKLEKAVRVSRAALKAARKNPPTPQP